MADHRNGQEHPAEEQAPQATPESAPASPELDPVTDIVEADDLFLGVVAFADGR